MISCKKPGVAFWATVVVVVALVAYPLSFGPVVWLTGRGYFRESTVSSVYRPVLWSTAHVESLGPGVDWWASLFLPDDQSVTLQIQTDEASYTFWFARN